MNTKCPKGAEWRRWDLHFHTPASYDYKDKSVTSSDIVDTLVEKGVSVVAITDHHVIDILRIQELQTLGAAKDLTILPGIEFLSDARGSVPVHFIAIFPQDCNLEFIWGQIQNKTAIAKIAGEQKKENEIYCDFAETTSLIKDLGGIITVHAGSKSNSLENISHSLPHSACQKEDLAKIVDIFEVGKEQDIPDYKKHVITHLKNKFNLHHSIIICSDNHDVKNYSVKQNCWLKADPTFDGLKQVIIEPEERIYIGDAPPLLGRVQANRTKYIKSISVNQEPGYDSSAGVWFKDTQIPLNSELVAIIGNKGSGKSALADIIALCSNYNELRDFSFLTTKKFRANGGKIAKNFSATLGWESGVSRELNLNEVSDDSEILKVKYIPQGQFDRLTNEIATIEEFQKEIEKVVFSHISDDDKLGTSSFDELVKLKTQSVDRAVEELEKRISASNEKIIQLEAKALPTFKTSLEKKLEKKQEELEALTEPEKVESPAEEHDSEGADTEVRKNVAELKEEIEGLENSIDEQEQKKQKLLKDIQTLSDLESAIKSQVESLTTFIHEKKSELVEWGIDVSKMISVETDYTEIEEAIATKKKTLETLRSSLGEEWQEFVDGDWPDDASDDQKEQLYGKLKQKKYDLALELKKLSDKEKAYQDYLTKEKAWEKEKSQITGDSVTPEPGTINQIKVELSYLDEQLQTDLEAVRAEREKDVRSVFAKKQEVVSVYKNARDQLNAIITRNADTLKDYKISVDAAIVPKVDFGENILGRISKNVSGTFYNKLDGEQKFKEICASKDFDNEDDVIAMVDEITEALHHDKRDGQSNAWRDIQSQVKDVESLYDYLYSLSFLDYNYQLKQGDKRIEQLSPGERGALLLVFYLLLDKSDIPLVIDQPEDNLDNHSVATVLVPFMRAAKQKRQIIMVTHNPNLAVVSDAEQVIYAGLDKENNYTFSTVSGSIEDEEVNEKIVDVLEGAMPAFKTRKRKYYDKLK
jgi:ABC-type lipoprotein export system ATPase subunit